MALIECRPRRYYEMCGCTVQQRSGHGCLLHGNKSITVCVETCAVCQRGTKILCKLCWKSTGELICRWLALQTQGTSIWNFYVHTMTLARWPSFIRNTTDFSHINENGSTTHLMHPFAVALWTMLTAMIKRKKSVYIDTTSNVIWSVGAWIQHTVCKLPLGLHNIRIILDLEERKQLDWLDDKAVIRLFRIYVTEAGPKANVLFVKGNTIFRKKTRYNIITKQDILRVLEAAEYNGVATEDIFKETPEAAGFIQQLGSKVLMIHNRLYLAPTPIYKLARKLKLHA